MHGLECKFKYHASITMTGGDGGRGLLLTKLSWWRPTLIMLMSDFLMVRDLAPAVRETNDSETEPAETSQEDAPTNNNTPDATEPTDPPSGDTPASQSQGTYVCMYMYVYTKGYTCIYVQFCSRDHYPSILYYSDKNTTYA